MKSENRISSSEAANANPEAGKWDFSDVSFAGDQNADAAQIEHRGGVDLKAQTREQVKLWSDFYRDAEYDFAKYAKTADLSTEEGLEKYRINVRNYEDEVRSSWSQMENATSKARRANAANDIYDIADLQRIGSGTLNAPESIEAASSIFYNERVAALKQKIEQNAATPEEAESQIDLLGNTWSKVKAYLDATKDIETMHSNINKYHSHRNTSHNAMIRQLNQMNDLAEKYQTERFTPRNFITNDYEYNEYRDKNHELYRRTRYDRDSVLGYFTGVFSDEFLRSQKYIERNAGSLNSLI